MSAFTKVWGGLTFAILMSLFVVVTTLSKLLTAEPMQVGARHEQRGGYR